MAMTYEMRDGRQVLVCRVPHHLLEFGWTPLKTMTRVAEAEGYTAVTWEASAWPLKPELGTEFVLYVARTQH
jgi:hypothetical protein